MSKSAKPREIEDVLSSIRRLVTEETEALTRPAAGRVGRLVLTPALRVAPDGTGANGRGPVDLSVAAATRARPLALPPSAAASQDADAGDLSSLEERIAELEAAVCASDEEWDADACQGTSVRGAMGPTACDGVAPTGQPGIGARAGVDGADETAILDEEMLRALVSDIVRQELQGALGDRVIARNVRKVVRREVSRALGPRDHD